MVHKNTPRTVRKKMFFILGALLMVNAGVAHILIDQIAIRTNAQTQVLGSETVAKQGELVTGNAHTPLEEDAKPEITVYTVQTGDTISGIAEKFNISTSTIRWANELDKKSTIKVGQKLVILPITGIQYTVKKGDTLSGITKKFDADGAEILSFNDLENADELKVGMKLIIPDAEPLQQQPTKPAPTKTAPKSTTTTSTTSSKSTTSEKEEIVKSKTSAKNSKSTFATPVSGAVLTQGLHAVNAVDFGAATGSAVHAVKGGTVIVAKGGGAYNGGFGNMIVVDHGNGTQALYAHLSKVQVKVGDSIDKGEQIGLVGNTGKSTGPHLHLEIHGAKNPWTADKKGTHY